MKERIILDPVTRISGFLEIRATLEDKKIVEVESKGLLFRGFEQMLIGRYPLDSTYFTERICGICSTAHAYASTLGIEQALGLTVTRNDNYLRDLLHGFEYIQNHLRQFFLFTFPSYVRFSGAKMFEVPSTKDFRLPDVLNKKMEQHYIESIKFSRLAHEGVAVLGGKAPHNHGIFAGGVTTDIDAYKIAKLKSLIVQLEDFVSTIMMEDMNTLSEYYADYYKKGISYPYFMSYGAFDQYAEPEISYVKPGVMINGVLSPLLPNEITEQIKYAWYKKDNGIQEVDLNKPDAYTFIKAPRYHGLPMEVGPLARLIITGEYVRGHSCMDRNAARVLETRKILGILNGLINRIELVPNNQGIYEMPMKSMGAGLVDTTRGSLGHWVSIENKVISHYNIIPPSVWNLSPRDESGVLGVIERALLDTEIDDVSDPIEIGRIVRSFDPCVSCATHVIGETNTTIETIV